MTQDRATTISLLVVSAAVGGLLALVGAFLVPPLDGRWASVGTAIALLTTGPYAHLVGRAFRSSAAATVPALGWLLTTMYFTLGRPEGDFVVPATWYGIAFLLLGTLSAAVGIGTVASAQRRADKGAADRAAAREAAAQAAEAEAAH